LRKDSRHLDKELEIAENCEKVDSQLAAMATEGQGMKAKEEDSSRVNCIEEKRELLGRIHNSPTTDVVKLGIFVKTQTSQQEVSFVNMARNVNEERSCFNPSEQ